MKPYYTRPAKPAHLNRHEVMYGKQAITQADEQTAILWAIRLNAAYEAGVKDTLSQTGEVVLTAAAARVEYASDFCLTRQGISA